jgi:hypothetical protein
MRFPLLKTLSMALACAALSALVSGCILDGDGTNGNSKRTYSVKTRIYTDQELGYKLTFPEGWLVQAAPKDGYGLIDFIGLDRQGKFSEPSASAYHTLAYEDETLQSYVDNYGSYSGDSARILPLELRHGVEVIAIDSWSYDSYYTERSRVLHFIRNGHLVKLSFAHLAANFDTSAAIRFLDSSLTFF